MLTGNPEVEETEREEPKRVEGKIFYLNTKPDDGGYGFIESNEPELKFKRIYFQWKFLLPDTLTFDKLKNGMRVEFTPKLYPQGWNAIKVRVIEDE